MPPSTASSPAPPRIVYDPGAIVLVACCAGVALDRGSGGLASPLWWWVALACWCGWLLLWRRRHDRAAALVLCGNVFSLLAAWHHSEWRDFDRGDLGRFAAEESRPVAVEAVAANGPRRAPAPPFDPMRAIPRGDRTRLELRITAVRAGTHWRSAAGRATLFVDGHLLGVHAGDRLRLFAQLSAPRAAQNPGEFDFALHARGEGRLSLLRAESPACVEVLGRGGALHPRRWLEELRSRGDGLLWRHLRHERSGLAAALLLGAREQLDDEQTEAFLQTGTVHVLAISGTHVTLLAAALFGLLRLGVVPRRRALLAVAALTWLYTLVTDCDPSAVRAAVLVAVGCLSLAVWRRASAVNGLSVAGIVVLLMNPADLFGTGAQLSFLAVATLVWFARYTLRREQDPLDRLIAATRPWPVRALRTSAVWMGRLLAAGLAVWLVSLPLVMARFHLLSPAGVLLTAATWIPVSLALLSGFAVLMLGWLVPPLGNACGWICDGNLSLLDWSVRESAALPGSHYWVPGPDDWWLVGFYGALALWWALPQWRPPRRWRSALLAGWTAVGLLHPLAASASNGPPQTECAFVSVGHGLATVLHLPDGRTLLYDAGSLGSPKGATNAVAAYLWSRGVTHLDAVVVSHADVDHYNGLPGLLERFTVGVVYVSPVMFDVPAEGTDRLRAAIDEAGVPLREIHAGQRLQAGEECDIEVLHPPRRGMLGSDNANSICLAIECGGRRLLLTGDLETPGLEALLAEEPIDCDVLLAPHHGSRHSDPPGMAAWSRPEWVVVSGGHGDESAAVERAYAERGARVLHTAESGAVLVALSADGVDVRTFKRQAE